uniref:Uncharacterized protein n=1 Tax=Ixodes ricinus TaxID=34613 RepID=A0A147BD18_IXORI
MIVKHLVTSVVTSFINLASLGMLPAAALALLPTIFSHRVMFLFSVGFQLYLETFYLILFFLISRHSPRFRSVMGVPMVPESWVLHFFFSSSRLHCLC